MPDKLTADAREFPLSWLFVFRVIPGATPQKTNKFPCQAPLAANHCTINKIHLPIYSRQSANLYKIEKKDPVKNRGFSFIAPKPFRKTNLLVTQTE
jgi:hypothetical protein